MSRRKIPNNNHSNTTLESLIKKLGSSGGTIIVLLTVLSMGFGAGVYYGNILKNIEILELNKSNFIELQELKNQNLFLKIEQKELNNKITENEKKGKN